ncbi:hypothetical protein EMN47_08310, partial [Prolixibacteraceae bacterium JC049]|nr:hypothetical protein [Prolixibacteraceae bacterium JC049]
MKTRIFDIFLSVILLLVVTTVAAQPTIPTPNNPPSSGSGSSGSPLVVCSGVTSTFYVLVNEDSEAGDISQNDFEWRVYGGTIVSAVTGSFSSGPTTNVNNGQNYSVATQSSITNTASQDQAKITIQWDTSGFTGGWIAVRQSSQYNCTNGTWSLFYVNVSNLPSAPTSGGDQAYCTGSTIPALSATVSSGETVDWYAASTGGTALLSGNTSYTPTAAGTYYAEARNTTTGCVSSTRTAVVLTENSVTAGAIASAQTICSGDTPAAFTSTTAATGTGGVSYQWQSSTDNSSFSDISGETSATYTPSSGITQDTWYRRAATSTTGGCIAYTTSVKVTVGSVTAGAIASAQTICSGDTPAAFTSTTAATGTDGVSYQWQSSTDNSSFSDISGETSATYTPSSGITQDTWYRRKATSTTGSCVAYTTSVKVTVGSVTAGAVASAQTICSGDTPAAFTSTTAATGTGGVSYQWQSSADNSSFNDISGETSATY